MKMLESKLHTDAPTMYGNTWKDILETVTAKENKVIHSLENPVAKEPGLKILKGIFHRQEQSSARRPSLKK